MTPPPIVHAPVKINCGRAEHIDVARLAQATIGFADPPFNWGERLRWGRRYRGVDLNPEYVRLGNARVQEESFGWAEARFGNETPQEAWVRRNEI